MLVLTWLKERSIEPSTWLGISICLMGVALMVPTWLGACIIAAVITAVVAMSLKEESNRH